MARGGGDRVDRSEPGGDQQRQLFMQRNVLSEIDGVFNVRVEPMPVVNDPDIDERLLITGVELAVEVEEAR